MKVRTSIIIIVCVSLFTCFSLYMSLRYVQQIAHKVSAKPEEAVLHIAVYVPETVQSFFSEMLAGINDFCIETNTAVSVHTMDAESSLLSTAPYTGSDGIVVYSISDTKATAASLDIISEKNIPLVLIDHSIPTNNPHVYIGMNNFELGRYIGNYLCQEAIPNEEIYPAIIYSEKSPGMYAERELIEMGLLSALGTKLSGSVITAKTSLNRLDAEEVVTQLLEEYPSINTLIFTNTEDTLLYAKMTVELNMVGKNRLIGFGNTDTINDYLMKDVLSATVSVDAYQLGWQAMQAVVNICKNGYSSSYVNTGFDFITNKTKERQP